MDCFEFRSVTETVECVGADARGIRVLIAAGVVLGEYSADSKRGVGDIGVGRQDIALGVRLREQVAARIVGKGSGASVRLGDLGEHAVAVVSQRYPPTR